MNLIKRNYGWIIVLILAVMPLFILGSMVNGFDFANFSYQTSSLAEKDNLAMLYHVSGEFAIRWMTAVLTCTPFFILFGVTNLFVRQAMGIATAVWSFIHFILFILAEGFLETFTQVNYITGLIAALLLIPLLLTSNRKAMRTLKQNWKKLQRFAYIIIFLSLVHVAILDKTWIFYSVIVGLGFILRIPSVKNTIVGFRMNRKFKS